MNGKEIEKSFIEYINYHKGVISTFGELKFTNKNRIGQGGNGLVYLATINEKKVAIKFLISDSKEKINRFKSEYFNTNYVKNDLKNIINMIHYDELEIKKGVVVPYILMSPYSKNINKKKRKLKRKILYI